MKTHIILLIALLNAAPAAYGEADEKEKLQLSLDKAVYLALENSEELKIEEEKRSKTHNTYWEIKSSVFPQVSGMASLDNYIESPVLNFDMGMGPVSIPLKQEWDTRYGLTVSQVLCTFGKLGNGIRIAERAISVSDLSVNAARNELVFVAKQMYYTMLFTSENLRISQESYDNAQNNMRVLREKYKGGRVSRMENVKMEADIAMRYTAVQQARSAYDEVEVSFRDLLGIAEGSEIAFTDFFPQEFQEYDTEDLRNRMLEAEPVTGIMRANMELSRLAVKHARSDFFPVVAGYLSYSYAGNSEEIYDNMEKEVIAGVRLDVPVWDSFKRYSSLRKSINDRHIAELEYGKRIRQVDVELESILAKYERLIDTYNASLKAEKLAEESYAIAFAGFRSGVAGQSALNDAEIQLTSAKKARIGVLYEISITNARIEKLSGKGVKR
ncbi:MAG: TolC family protein [Elusimicrobia bacterium]|nr:TolC family protein [Elusimicrobiota bacterium]